jgi:EcsC protein family
MNETIAAAIRKMALIESAEAKESLKSTAKSYTLSGWKTAQTAKLGGVGALTGLVGGPVGLALEGLDIAYLLAAAGRGCYGIGHILGKDIDYDADLTMILAVWCGAAEASTTVAAGKIGIKVGGTTGLGIGAKVAGKLAGKLASKSAFKLASKSGAVVVGLAATKLATKIASKLAVKWIPIIGGIVGAGINVWIMNGLLSAAESYYSAEYVVVSDDLASAA